MPSPQGPRMPNGSNGESVICTPMPLQELSNRVRNILSDVGAIFREVEHEPVLDYDTAAVIRQRFNLKGTESKSLFLKTKDGRYAMYVTLEGKRADLKAAAQLLGSKVSIAGNDELTAQTGCIPGCACPFGHDPSITLLVDKDVLGADYLIFSPGPAERTIELGGAAIPSVLKACGNPVLYVEPPPV